TDVDPYWTTGAKTSDRNDHDFTCTYSACLERFGTVDVPGAGRDLTIVEAFEDHVELIDRSTKGQLTAKALKCCFQTAVAFNVRPANQWTALGQLSGFLHHVIPEPATGVCRNSCDPRFARLNGRVRQAASVNDLPIHDGDALAFINPVFRFGI